MNNILTLKHIRLSRSVKFLGLPAMSGGRMANKPMVPNDEEKNIHEMLVYSQF